MKSEWDGVTIERKSEVSIMEKRNILVIRDSFSDFDHAYEKFLIPYLDFLEMCIRDRIWHAGFMSRPPVKF